MGIPDYLAPPTTREIADAWAVHGKVLHGMKEIAGKSNKEASVIMKELSVMLERAADVLWRAGK